MDPMTTIAGVAGAVKSIADMVGGLRGNKKADPETERVLLEIETRLVALKTEVLGLKEHIVDLKAENTSLREEIGAKQEGALERQQYKRKTMGQAVVMTRDDEPGVFYCATCYARNQFIPLQPRHGSFRAFGSHTCSTCNSNVNITG